MYLEVEKVSVRKWAHLLENVKPRVLYLNSLFDFRFSISPLLAAPRPSKRFFQVVIAPRGELSPGALSIKTMKKHLYLRTMGPLGLYERVLWHACSDMELQEMKSVLQTYLPRALGKCFMAPNIPSVLGAERTLRKDKASGVLNVVYYSRITRKKNLLFAIDALGGVGGAINFDIYGPVIDAQYWAECRAALQSVPRSITWSYKGALERHQVLPVLSQYDVLILPTHSENFGHVIIEALAAGTPVLLSDNTPWKDLESFGAGWTRSLTMDNFRSVLHQLVAADEMQLAGLRRKAVEYSNRVSASDEAVRAHAQMFQAALA
jgi:glycosyltransferase involved in cell wall biosynthesis